MESTAKSQRQGLIIVRPSRNGPGQEVSALETLRRQHAILIMDHKEVETKVRQNRMVYSHHFGHVLAGIARLDKLASVHQTWLELPDSAVALVKAQIKCIMGQEGIVGDPAAPALSQPVLNLDPEAFVSVKRFIPETVWSEWDDRQLTRLKRRIIRWTHPDVYSHEMNPEQLAKLRLDHGGMLQQLDALREEALSLLMSEFRPMSEWLRVDEIVRTIISVRSFLGFSTPEARPLGPSLSPPASEAAALEKAVVEIRQEINRLVSSGWFAVSFAWEDFAKETDRLNAQWFQKYHRVKTLEDELRERKAPVDEVRTLYACLDRGPGWP